MALLATEIVSGGARCETSALRITIPQETIVQTSISAKATTSTVEIFSPSGDVGGFPRFKTLDIKTQGGGVQLRNLFGIGGPNPEDGFTVDSNGGPVELNTIKAGPIDVNSGGGAITVNSTICVTFLTKVRCFYVMYPRYCIFYLYIAIPAHDF